MVRTNGYKTIDYSNNTKSTSSVRSSKHARKTQHCENAQSTNNCQKTSNGYSIGQILGTFTMWALSNGLQNIQQNNEGESTADKEEKPEVEVSEEEKEVSITQLRENMCSILLRAGIQAQANDEIVNDLIKKRDAYKSIYPNKSKKEIDNKLYNYAKALQYHNTQLQMSKYTEEHMAEIVEIETNQSLQPNQKYALIKVLLDESGIVYKDSDISSILEKAKGVAQDSEEYANLMAEYKSALLSNGEGMRDFYDTNNDQKVSYEEYLNAEQKDAGRKLNHEEKSLVKQAFESLDANNDGSLSVEELVANDLGYRKILDSDQKATANDLTTAEWYFGQNAMTNNGDENLKFYYNKFKNGALEQFGVQ